jgi:C4-dicarboxylate-specific signal transduction histidine kinase
MTTEMRKSGIDVVGDMPWGTHVCLFYETKEDLLDTLVSYCKAGLESQEFCLWVVAEPVSEEEARHALQRVVPDLDRYLADHSIDIVSAGDWYLQGGTFDLKRVMDGWHERLALSLARGYAGVRVTGDTAWLEKKDWKDFCEYEETLNESIANQRLAVLCTYPLAACGAAEILDVARTHQFVIAKRRESWEIIETPGLKQAKAEIKRINEELEQRVVERTSQLTAVNEELRKEILERKRAEEALHQAQAELAHATRVTTLGELAASIAHEINQPLAAIVADANACLHWLEADRPDLDSVRGALAAVAEDGDRAAEVISRIRGLLSRSAVAHEPCDLARIIREVHPLVRPELGRHGMALETFLAKDVPAVMGDRIQLQQVLLNLLVNAVEALREVAPERRRLTLHSTVEYRDDGPWAVVRVEDGGVGLRESEPARLFEAFYTTKPGGLGMGLSISRSIIEGHGGRLWATANADHGATFHFTLPGMR